MQRHQNIVLVNTIAIGRKSILSKALSVADEIKSCSIPVREVCDSFIVVQPTKSPTPRRIKREMLMVRSAGSTRYLKTRMKDEVGEFTSNPIIDAM